MAFACYIESARLANDEYETVRERRRAIQTQLRFASIIVIVFATLREVIRCREPVRNENSVRHRRSELQL